MGAIIKNVNRPCLKDQKNGPALGTLELPIRVT